MAGGGAEFGRGRVGFLDLTKNFGFAQHHGIESADHAEKMPRAARGIVKIERRVETGAGSQKIAQTVKSAHRAQAGGVEFHAVAGGKNDRAGESVDGPHGRKRFAQLMVADGEFLADVHGSVVMVEAGAEDVHGREERY